MRQSREADFIAALRALAVDPAARGLLDDAAVIDTHGPVVVTHDMMAEGVHYLPDDPPESVAWRLVAVNLSDLGAKGAEPLGVLLGYSLGHDSDWDRAFVAGLGEALAAFRVPLLGGDTIALPADAPRVMGLTAMGRAPAGGAPSRGGAKPGDLLCVTGTIGDAALGLAIRKGDEQGDAAAVDAFLRPLPPVAFGVAVAAKVHAMMDLSDGLLIDAGRMAAASGCAARIALDAVPLSAAYAEARGQGLDARLAATTGGDDYQLLMAVAPDRLDTLKAAAASAAEGVRLTVVGACAEGSGLVLTFQGEPVAVPNRLGWLHG